MAPTPERVIEAAQAYKSVRWQHQGRSLKGIDCVGLLIVAFRDAGIIVEDVRDYARTPDGERLTGLLKKYCVMLSGKAEPQQADIIALRFEDMPQHVAIVTRQTQWGPYIIHAFGNEQMGGKVIEHMLDDRWLKSHRGRIHAIFRPKTWAGDLKEEAKGDCGC